MRLIHGYLFSICVQLNVTLNNAPGLLLYYFWMSGLLSGQEIHLSKAEALKLCTHYTAFKKVSLQQFHYHL